MNPATHVVIGILRSNQHILIAQRHGGQDLAGLWEFPGGKVENNEASYDALQREFKEEIGIKITNAHFLYQYSYHYPHKTILFDVWEINAYEGTPRGAEGQPILWVMTSQLTSYSFPEGNQLIIEKLPAEATVS